MKYQSGTRKKAVEYEKALVKYWKENKLNGLQILYDTLGKEVKRNNNK